MAAGPPLESYASRILVAFPGSNFFTHDGDLYVNNELYKGKLLEAPDFRFSMTDGSWGLREPQSVTLRFSNAKEEGATRGYWSQIEYDGDGDMYPFNGLSIWFYRYEPLDSTPKRFLFSGYIVDHNITDEVAEFTVSDDYGWLDFLIPPYKLEEDTFKTLQPDAEYRPDADFGKALTIAYGNVHDVPLLLINNDTVNDQYDYFLCMKYGFTLTITDLTVYRCCDGQLWLEVDPAEYTLGSFDTGTIQGAKIRFNIEQSDGNNFCTLKADFTVANTTRNHAQMLSLLLNYFGRVTQLSILISAAADVLTSRSIYCDAAYTEQQNARDIVNDILSTTGMFLYFEPFGLWPDTLYLKYGIDQYIANDTATFGLRDGYYNNILKVISNKKVALEDTCRYLSLKYQYSPEKGKFLREVTRDVFTYGKSKKTFETQTIWDDEAARRAINFKQGKIYYGQRHLTIEVGLEGRNLALNEIVRVIMPELDIDGRFQIIAIRKELGNVTLDLQEHTQEQYQQLPSPTVPETGIFTLTGKDVIFAPSWLTSTMVADKATYTLTGKNAALGLSWRTTYEEADSWLYSSSPSNNYRVVIPAGEISLSGTKIKILFKAHNTQDMLIDGCSIGERASSDSSAFTGTPTRVTFGSSNTTTVSAGVDKWSDEIDFTLDETKDYLVHIYNNDASLYFAYASSLDTYGSYWGSDDQEDMTMTALWSATGYGSNRFFVAKITVLPTPQ